MRVAGRRFGLTGTGGGELTVAARGSKSLRPTSSVVPSPPRPAISPRRQIATGVGDGITVRAAANSGGGTAPSR
jgi:hypothetical protein